MPEQNQISIVFPAHQNHGLFSDNYLNEVLPERQAWKALAAEARPVLDAIAQVFTNFSADGANERQTEDDLICPILRLLGHEFEVQAALKTPLGTKSPDYVFFRDADAKLAQRGAVLTDALPTQGALAIGDAKKWDRPLDIAIREKGADPFSNQIPAVQIAFYMQHSSLPWGILTNGRQWRIVHHDTAHKLDVFYEVNLENLVESGDVMRFLYFYAFFRRTAFEPGLLGLAEMLRESIDYAHAIGSHLKEQIFDALRHLAQGFLDYAPNKLQPDETTLQEVYDNALIVLYRLIFILYAEARDLLPVRDSQDYLESYSLQSIKSAVSRNIAHGRHLLPGSALLWPRLRQLFQIIDRGSPPLKVATFNGGLFDPIMHAYLEVYTVGDAHLQKAIDMLARVDGEFVDYRDLSVQHMGTIYEGLLEFRLQPLAMPEEGWTVELVNDKGERKATGSYYTPETIVKFIVEHTVGPALWKAVEGKRSDPEIVQAVLGVNVLDPAMGSGHFLVEATEFIARFLADYGIVPEGKTPEEADLAFWKRRVVQSCIYGVDLNPLAVELAKLSLWLITVAKNRPLSFLDHHLRPGNSLAGAWMEHLEIGNGKAKKTKQQVEQEGGQIVLFGDSAFTQQVYKAVNNMWVIEETEANTVDAVKEQERSYNELRQQFVAKYARLLNLVTANYLDLEITPELRQRLIDYALKSNGFTFPDLEKVLEKADATAERERFFHWELEFPEVFFDRFGRTLGEDGGFEVVLGNPPYVRQEQLSEYKPLFRARFSSYHGTADLYLYFYEQGLRLTRRAGRLGFISSGTFARANFAVAFRQWLPTVAHLETVIDYGENQPFPGAEMVRPSIALLRKGAGDSGFRSLFLANKVPESLDHALAEDGVECDPDVLEESEWVFQARPSTSLFQKIMAVGRPLKEVLVAKVYRGLTIGLNEAFLIDQPIRDRLVAEDSTCSVLLKHILRGEDMRPWYQEEEGRWLITIPCGWTVRTFGTGLPEEQAWDAICKRHPGLAAQLEPFADAARARCDKGNFWWELRPCDYYDAFDSPKIFWAEISKLPRFSWDETGLFTSNKGHLASTSDIEILGILQSRVIWYAISNLCVPLRLRAGLWQYQLTDQFITRLPIPDLSPSEKEEIGSIALQITELARARYTLHQRVRYRLQTDLGTPAVKMNQKLTAWWEQDFSTLRDEVKKVFKRDIPLSERSEWEAWHCTNRSEHARLTTEIVRLETELNAHVYAAFHLSAEEILLIEESTKYQYGQV